MDALTAREHAIRASWLVAEPRRTAEQLDLARTHALTALALCMTEEDPNPDDAEGRFA